MYNYRSRPSILSRWLFGLVIVVVAVGVFIVYQMNIPSPAQSTATATKSGVALVLTATTPTAAPTKIPVTYRIVSDKASISAVITELYYATDSDNWDLSHLGSSAGHLEGTPMMGLGGNFVLAGHVELKDGSQGPFAQLTMLTAGDLLTIIGDTIPAPSVHQYQVTDIGKVLPTDFAVMRNHGYEELTLITCDDYNPKTQTYNSRVIVHARPVMAPTAAATKALNPLKTAMPTLTPKKK
jgi:LPXTG-site transpeptidase (sortase) family protein